MGERAAELHDEFVHDKDRLAAESLLTARLKEKNAPKLSNDEHATFIKELMSQRTKQLLRVVDFERAFEALKPIRDSLDQVVQQLSTERVEKDKKRSCTDEERKKLREDLLKQLAKEWLADC